MKKLGLILGCALIAASSTFAQSFGNSYDDVWKRTKSWGIGFVSSKLSQDGISKGSKFGIATDLTKTYYVVQEPIGDFMKIGIDAKWFDFNYANYKYDYNGATINLGDMIDMDEYDYDYDYDGVEIPDLGTHCLTLGVGVGPSFQFAPFTNVNNALSDIRADVFCHFTPSFSMLLLQQDDETNVYYGFSPVVNFGVNLQWKMIGLGFEGRWGFPRYNDLMSDLGEVLEDHFDSSYNSSGSPTFKTSAFRFFIRLNF